MELSDGSRREAEAIAALAYCNPFLERRVELERQALGDRFVDTGNVWHQGNEPSPNLAALGDLARQLLAAMRRASGRRDREETRLYRDLAIYSLYDLCEQGFHQLIVDDGKATRRVEFYGDYAQDFDNYFAVAGLVREIVPRPERLFAWLFQVRRAFHYIFRYIHGGSMPAARLRAEVWQSIFTHDMRRYRRGLFERMGDITTLITGPSGTGKELVAQAIGMARFIPFDARRQGFAEDFRQSFFPINLSAFSPTLVEAELFGHRRGAFTGAVESRAGWFEVCPAHGTVFLDEIGDVEVALQVKLLRVLQTRIFQRIGESRDRTFGGKIVAATNRDPAEEMAAGRMREDFYYRISSDLVRTPSLAEQLADSSRELPLLVGALTERLVGEDLAPALADEVVGWIERDLGAGYSWPGNVRELEQCIRNVMIRGSYRPGPRPAAEGETRQRLAAEFLAGAWTLDELTRAYTTLVYSEDGTYLGTARRLEMDRRTVKSRVDEELLAELAPDSAPG